MLIVYVSLLVVALFIAYLFFKNSYKPNAIFSESLFVRIIAIEYASDRNPQQNETRTQLVKLLDKHKELIDHMIHYCVIKKPDNVNKVYHISDYIKKEFIKVDRKSEEYYVHIEKIISAVNNPKQPSFDQIAQSINVNKTDEAFVELGKLMYEEAKKPTIESLGYGPGWL